MADRGADEDVGGAGRSRYIDSDALRKEHCEDCNEIKDDPNCDICATMQWVNDAPTADVAPVVHGHYVFDDDGDSSCSVCHEKYLDHTQNHCPNCGAKMDG